ncbi:hypothetical protein ACHQM5_002734 [Ranunculus cassubicifolius]
MPHHHQMALGGSHADGAEDDTVVGYKGQPFDKSRTGGWLGAGLILGTELAERVCVIGISMNLVTYLVGDLHISAPRSANVVTNFMGTLNMLALLGGFLADAKLGRYLTVAIFGSIATLGVTLLTIATTIPSMKPPSCSDYRSVDNGCIEANGRQIALLFAALYTIALGGGGIKANVSGFGSDQFDVNDPKEKKAMIFFFNRFFLCISLGSLFAVTVLVYIQDNVGRGYGYGIAAGVMAIAVIVLLAGTRSYRYKKPKGSPLAIIWRVFCLAWKNRKLPYPSDPSMLHEYHNTMTPHTKRLRGLDKAAIKNDSEANGGQIQNHWIVSTVTEVEEVKMVLKLIPIWSTCILFWTVYSQMTTFSIEQATIMNRNIGSFVIPSGSMSFFLIFTILVITSLNEKLFVPLARKLTHNVSGLTSLQRISMGLIVSIIAMVAAAIVEKKRRENEVQGHGKISVFWLVPQFFLVGAGEAFAYVGQLEFFIKEAPEKMKSMSTGLFLSTLSMGFFVSSLLVSLVHKITGDRWIRSNLNKGKLENFYWLLAILGVLNFFLFLFFSTRHEYKVEQYKNSSDGEEVKGWNGGSLEDIEKIEGGV